MRFDRRSILTAGGFVFAGCTLPTDPESTSNGDGQSNPGSGGTVTRGEGATEAPSGVGYPHVRASGNRVVSGRGSVPGTDPIDVALDETPTWLAAVPTADGSVWAVVDRSDTLTTVAIRGVDVDSTVQGSWPSERPAVVQRRDDAVSVVDPPPEASDFAPPLVLDDGVAAVASDGGLLVDAGGSRDRLDADLLPDARLSRLDPGSAVALGGPTTRYDHGALGDDVEASEIVLADLKPPAIDARFSTSEGRVVEGTAPIVAELGGERGIVVTESDADGGARIVAYDRAGDRIAESDPIGLGFRWRHQLAVAPFGPNGETEIAAVETPHIGGTAEFFRRDGDRLERVATVSGASSHAYGSRNLDGGVAADADADGRTELIVPDDARERLRGIERRGASASVEWSVPVGGQISTNVLAVGHGDGLAVGVGHSGGQLRVWPPG